MAVTATSMSGERTLVLDNSGALINDTTGRDWPERVYPGCGTNVLTGAGYTHSAGVLTATNNSYNASVYMGDAPTRPAVLRWGRRDELCVGRGRGLHEQRRVHDRRTEHGGQQH